MSSKRSGRHSNKILGLQNQYKIGLAAIPIKDLSKFGKFHSRKFPLRIENVLRQYGSFVTEPIGLTVLDVIYTVYYTVYSIQCTCQRPRTTQKSRSFCFRSAPKSSSDSNFELNNQLIRVLALYNLHHKCSY